MNTIPIVIPCYNRVHSLERLLQSLENAVYYDETPLIFSIDHSGSNDLYEYVQNFQWRFGEKKIIKHPQNIGLKNNILFCGNLTEKYEAVIVLEDDLVVANDFYNYAIQAYNFYKEDSRIAGISLYKYERAEVGYHQFYPIETNYDAYLMGWPSSWGQMWTKKQWREFKSWLENANDDIQIYNIPDYVKAWDMKSWKKWAVAYLSETDKFYLFPYKAFTNEFGTIGIHYSQDLCLQNINTVSLYCGINKKYSFGAFNDLPKYDSYFQPCSNKIMLNNQLYDITYNIYNCRKKSNINTEFVISPIKIEDEKVIASFPFLNFPIELNFDSNTINTDKHFFYLYKTIHFEDKIMNYTQKEQLRMLHNTRESFIYYFRKIIKGIIKKIIK